MKVLKALGRMLLDILKFILYVVFVVGIGALMLGLVYCADQRHEIVAKVILWTMSGVSILFVGLIVIVGTIEWFRKHYR